jgi:hypothetical protein
VKQIATEDVSGLGMGCVLRASGAHFDPEQFLSDSPLVPCNVFRKDERKSETRTWDTSGITILVSEAGPFLQQVAEAIDFLRSNRTELLRLKESPGLEDISLDFGVDRKNGFLQSHLFPSELISVCSEFGMGLEVSIYGTD